jgi:hypothetical protein
VYDETQGSGAFTDNSIVIDYSLFLFWHFDEFSHPNKSWSQEALSLVPKRDNVILPLIHRVQCQGIPLHKIHIMEWANSCPLCWVHCPWRARFGKTGSAPSIMGSRMRLFHSVKICDQ